MRTILMALAATGMLTVTPMALPTIAVAQTNNEALAFCKSVITDPPQDRNLGTLGECTSIFTVPDPGFAAHICDLWLERDQLEDFGYATYSECVRGELEFLLGD